MGKEKFCILSILVMMIAVAQSGTILRSSKEDSSETEGEDKGFPSDSKWDQPLLGEPDLGIDSFHNPSLPEHDVSENEIDDSKSEGEPDRFIPDLDNDELPDDDSEEDEKDVDGNVDDDDETDETDEGGIDKPSGGEDDLEESLGGKGDPEVPALVDEFPDDDFKEDGKDVDGNVDDETAEGGIDKSFVGEDDLEESLGGKDDPEESVLGGEEEVVDEGQIDEEKVVDEDQIDEENDKTSEGIDDALEYKPGFGGEATGPGFLGGGSIFDNPLFNLEQVRRYFHQMEKALEHVFKETVDEALLLNGTFANTTEEEVDINGKKYTVLKSVLKGRDNNTSVYVETLSSKPKEEGGEEAHSKKV